MAFTFREQFAIAQPLTEAVITWLNGRGKVRALDVQHVPALYSYGDILLEYPDGSAKYLELKVETRTSTDTPHLAIERWGNLQEKRAGSVWSTHAYFYAHVYADGYFWMAKTAPLRDWLEAHHQQFVTFESQNANDFSSFGYLVPRMDVPPFLYSLAFIPPEIVRAANKTKVET